MINKSMTIRKIDNGYMVEKFGDSPASSKSIFLESLPEGLEHLLEGKDDESKESKKEDAAEGRIKDLVGTLGGKSKGPKYMDMGEEEEEEKPKHKGMFKRVKGRK